MFAHEQVVVVVELVDNVVVALGVILEDDGLDGRVAGDEDAWVRRLGWLLEARAKVPFIARGIVTGP